jgi:hypothetical protein
LLEEAAAGILHRIRHRILVSLRRSEHDSARGLRKRCAMMSLRLHSVMPSCCLFGVLRFHVPVFPGLRHFKVCALP